MKAAIKQGINLFLVELKIRYRRAYFGLLWAFIPTLTAGLGFILAKKELSTGLENFNIVSFFFKLVLIQVILDAIGGAFKLSLRVRKFIRFFPFDYTAILYGGFIQSLFFLGMKILIVVALIFMHKPELHWNFFLYFFPAVLALGLVGLTLSAFLIPISYVYWDVRYAMGYLQGAIVFATPIFYNFTQKGFIGFVNSVNPLTYIVLFLNDIFTTGTSSYFTEFFIVLGVSLFLFYLGILFFKKNISLGAEHI